MSGGRYRPGEGPSIPGGAQGDGQGSADSQSRVRTPSGRHAPDPGRVHGPPVRGQHPLAQLDQASGSNASADSPQLTQTPNQPGGQPVSDTPPVPTPHGWHRVGSGYAASPDRQQREYTFSAADGGPWALAYGHVRVGGQIELLFESVHTTYALVSWCLGEISQVESIDFRDNAGVVPGTSTQMQEPTVLASYVGSDPQTVNSTLAGFGTSGALSDGWPFQLQGRAYSVLRANYQQDVSLLGSARATLKGLLVYDPRLSASYTDLLYKRNPPLLAGAAFAAWWGMDAGYAAVDWDRIGDAADACDIVIGTGDAAGPRFAIDVWLRAGMNLRTLLNTIALHCRGYWGRDGGKWYFDVERPKTSVFNFTDQAQGDGAFPNVVPGSVQVRTASRLREPSHMLATYTNATSFETTAPIVLPNPGSTVGVREAKLDLPWIQNRGMARRVAAFEFAKRTRDPAAVTWESGDVAQAVQVGDVVTLTADNVLTDQDLVVTEISKRDGVLLFQGMAYDEDDYNDDLETEDTAPSWTPPDVTGLEPTPPTGVSEAFILAGGWGDHNLLPDPDDLDDDTTAWMWSSAQVVYDAVNNWTRIFTLGVDTYTGKLEIAPKGNRIRGVMFAKWHADPSYPGSLSDIEIAYYAGADAGSAAKVGATYALDWCHEEWRPTLLDWEVATAAYHEILITCTPFATGEPDWDVRRCYLVDDTADPTLELSRRIGWTEDGDASTEVAEYQLVQSLDVGDVVQRIAGVPSGSSSLEVSLLRPSLLRGDTARDSMLRGRVAMRVLSADGVTTVDFPTVDLADQSFIAVDARVAVATLADTTAAAVVLGRAYGAGAGAVGELDANALRSILRTTTDKVVMGRAVGGGAGVLEELAAADLRDILGEAGGAHTITAGEQTAGTLDITTGLSSISHHLVQIYSSGELIAMAYAVSASGGTLTVADGAAESDYNITAGDIVHWQVWGAA